MSETNIEKDFYLVALGSTDIRVYESNPVSALRAAAVYRDTHREVWNYGPAVAPRLLPAPSQWRLMRETLAKEPVPINVREERVAPPETLLHEVIGRDDARNTVIATVVAGTVSHSAEIWDELRKTSLENMIHILHQQVTELTVPDAWSLKEISV